MGSKDNSYTDLMALHPEVSGSCNLGISKFSNGILWRYVVDCGLFQERQYEALNHTLPFLPENLDCAFVTHNHVDHTGRLPFMVKKGFCREIYTSEITTKLLPLALEDSAKVLKDVAKRKNVPCLYTHVDMEKTLRLLKPCQFDQTIQVGDYARATFLKNGHLMGAAMILVQVDYPGSEPTNILYTGDYNDKNMFFDVNPIPDWILKLPLTVVQESTYGNMDSTEIRPCFKENILRCIANGGTAIVPVFSLGRTQEILYVLKCMQEEGALSTNIPIVLDGKLAIAYTKLYLQNKQWMREGMEDFLPQNLTFVDKANRCDILKDTGAKIVLTTSGMGSYGPAQLYIPEYLQRRNSLIHFTGYTAEGTLGARLKNANKGEAVEVGGMLVIKRADVEYTTEYSAHAKADKMISFLKQPQNLKLVLFQHGAIQIKLDLAKRVLNEVDVKQVGILGRDYFFRVNPYGLVKSLSTKFE